MFPFLAFMHELCWVALQAQVSSFPRIVLTEYMLSPPVRMSTVERWGSVMVFGASSEAFSILRHEVAVAYVFI